MTTPKKSPARIKSEEVFEKFVRVGIATVLDLSKPTDTLFPPIPPEREEIFKFFDGDVIYRVVVSKGYEAEIHAELTKLCESMEGKPRLNNFRKALQLKILLMGMK